MKRPDSKELLVGRQYVMRLASTSDYDREVKTLTTEVVGVFRQKEETKGSPIWAYYPPFENSFFVSEEFLTDHLMTMEGVAVYELVWYWVFDHTSVYADELPNLIETMQYIENTANQILPGTRLWSSPLNIFMYFQRGLLLEAAHVCAQCTYLGHGLYFIVLAASLTVNRRQTEIAMREVRSQYFTNRFSYLIEWCMLGIVASW